MRPKTGHAADVKRNGSEEVDTMTRCRRFVLDSITQEALEVIGEVGDIRRDADCHHTAQPTVEYRALGIFSRRHV